MATDPLLQAVKEWAARERKHNPSFVLNVGRKGFTIDQIVEHIEKNTEEGKLLRKMIFSAAIDLFERANSYGGSK